MFSKAGSPTHGLLARILKGLDGATPFATLVGFHEQTWSNRHCALHQHSVRIDLGVSSCLAEYAAIALERICNP